MEMRTTDVSGVSMCYLAEGEGVPVLLLHGNTGCNLWYEKVMEMPGIAAWAPDLPNFGCSAHISEIEIDVYADYARAFADAVGLESPIVVGHSFGGAVAMSAVVRNPSWAKALVLVDSAPADGLYTPEAHYPVIEQYRQSRDLMRQALSALMPEVPDGDHFERLVDKGMDMNPEAYVGHAKALSAFDYTEAASRFQGAVHVIVGDKDPLITVDHARKSVGQFPNASLRIIQEVGHAVMVERPHEFVSIVQEIAGVADALR